MMKKNIFLLGAIACLISQPGLQAQEQKSRPNIIYIMSDDHAYQAISAYGYGLNNTPHIDKLAEKGMLFNRAFVTNSICGPSRAVMLTGKYSHINGFTDNHSTFDNKQQTVATVLHDAGYQTAVIGKWHLISDPVGFDYWNIVPGQGEYYNPDFIENGVRKKVTGYITNLTTDFAINWLDKRDKDKPFFMIYQQKAPHRNWMPEEKYYHLFDSTQFPVPANYFDDYKTRTRAAHKQEMEIATHMKDEYDLKLAFDLPKEKQVGLAPPGKIFITGLLRKKRKNGKLLMVHRMKHSEKQISAGKIWRSGNTSDI